MAKRKIKESGKGTEVNAEGNEKDDLTSSTTADVATYSIHDDNPKIAGMAAGYREQTKTK